MILSAVLYGIGFASAMPALQAITLCLASPDRIGVANASFSTATDLSIGLGAMALGWISQYTRYQIVFLVSAASVALALMIFLLVVHRLLKQNEHVPLQAESLAELQ